MRFLFLRIHLWLEARRLDLYGTWTLRFDPECPDACVLLLDGDDYDCNLDNSCAAITAALEDYQAEYGTGRP